MNREIEEMARIACVGFHEGDCENCPRRGFCSSYTVSRKLYYNDYRKESDVVEKIFADIEACFARSGALPETVGLVDFIKFSELRKKYEKEKRS